MPYGELPPLSDDEFARLLSGTSSPADYPEEERRAKTHAFFERLMREHPHQWQSMFDNAQEQFMTRMDAENGRASTFNPSGRRFKRKERKLMAQQWAFDAMGVNYDEHAKTADELLRRAEEMERLGKTFQKHGLL
jgi:hypothetical protein